MANRDFPSREKFIAEFQGDDEFNLLTVTLRVKAPITMTDNEAEEIITKLIPEIWEGFKGIEQNLLDNYSLDYTIARD